jgi:hypothetical protein
MDTNSFNRILNTVLTIKESFILLEDDEEYPLPKTINGKNFFREDSISNSDKINMVRETYRTVLSLDESIQTYAIDYDITMEKTSFGQNQPVQIVTYIFVNGIMFVFVDTHGEHAGILRLMSKYYISIDRGLAIEAIQ